MNDVLKDANKLLLVAAHVIEKELEVVSDDDDLLNLVGAISLRHGMALLLSKYRGQEGGLFIDWDYVDHVLSERKGTEKPEFLAFLEKTFKCDGCNVCVIRECND